MNKIGRLIIYIVLMAIIPISVFFFLPSRVKYQVTERYTFSTAESGTMVGLAVMLPKDNTYQDVENVVINWPGDMEREDHQEVEVVILTGQSGADGIVEAVLGYDVTLRQGRISWDAEMVEQDLLPQAEIESDIPALTKEARVICAEEPDQPAYAIYQYTAGYLSWPEEDQIGGDQSALAAFESGIGVCAEFANLMTAFNRACGNPARSVVGLYMPMALPPTMQKSSTWNHPSGSHSWVEVWDNGEWVIADPSWASNMPFDRLWFGRSQGQYLSYGELGLHDRVYDEMMAWSEEEGELIGAMSAPLKFVGVSADGETTTITPVASVKKVSDGRMVAAVSLYLLILVGYSVVESRISKREKARSTDTPSP